MEEIKTPQSNPNYIELSDDTQSVGNIFNELSGELGELDFAEKSAKVDVKEKSPLRTAYLISGYVLWITIFVTGLLTLDVFARSSTDNALFTSLPVCPYLSYGISNYENTECKTLSMITADKITEKEKLEKEIAGHLVILIPKFMASLDIINSSKVQFIQDHTGNSRTSISDMIKQFQEIKNNTTYEWKDIECGAIALDEKWKFTVSCQVYGGLLLAPAGSLTKTSRESALAFLDRLNDPISGFRILSYPKTLDISEFSSADGIKLVFSTKTTLNLDLQYLPANKM